MVVLCYHGVSAEDDAWCVDPDMFSWQVAWLAKCKRATWVTFDDGYVDFVDAWQRIRQHGLRTILFAVSGRLGGRADWEGARARPLLGGDDLRALSREGVEIGAHTVSHPRLAALDPADAHDEIARSKDELEQVLGMAVKRFAYPYGVVTPTLAQAVRAAGFVEAFTARSGHFECSAFARRRLLIRRSDGRLRFVFKVLAGYASWVDFKMDARSFFGVI